MDATLPFFLASGLSAAVALEVTIAGIYFDFAAFALFGMVCVASDTTEANASLSAEAAEVCEELAEDGGDTIALFAAEVVDSGRYRPSLSSSVWLVSSPSYSGMLKDCRSTSLSSSNSRMRSSTRLSDAGERDEIRLPGLAFEVGYTSALSMGSSCMRPFPLSGPESGINLAGTDAAPAGRMMTGSVCVATCMYIFRICDST